MIRLLVADVSPLADPSAYAELYAGASSFRRAAADRFRFKKDRDLCIGAAALLDSGLGAYGLREKDMVYGSNEYGKPFFLNAPEICFSISHSASKVAVAFSDKEVGCDIELIADIDPSVAERFCSRDEYEAVMASKDKIERERTFFRIWTLKESYMKARGSGLSIPPESFSVLSGMPDSGYSLISPFSFEGYECALCFRKECGIPEVVRVDLADI